MKLNWDDIRTEYITGKESYDKLASKYRVSKRSVAIKGKEGEWAKQRAAHRKQIAEKAIKEVTDAKVQAAKELYDSATGLIATVYNQLKQNNGSSLPCSDLRQLSLILRDCKDILDIKSEKDIEEQNYRIQKLRKENESEESSHVLDLRINGISVDELKNYFV